MDEVKIYSVSVDDAQALLEIYGPYVANTAISFEYKVPSVEEFQNRIKKISAKFPYLKAVSQDGKILGYACAGSFKERAAYDWSVETTIYISQDFRKKGLGRFLYTELENRLKKMGVLNLNACIAVPKSDNDSHLTNDSPLFHEKLGYKLVGVFHDCGFKFNTWYDMVWMEKIIGEHQQNPRPVDFGNWK